MGSRSQMLPSSVAARHSRLTQDFTRLSSMLAKCILASEVVSKLQPDPASSPGEVVGGDVVVKVDPRHLRSRIQDLQQNVATI